MKNVQVPSFLFLLLFFLAPSESFAAEKTLSACWDFAFGANAAKFCSDRGVMREHSLSYVTEEQRRAGRNLARVAQSVKSQQALTWTFPLPRTHTGILSGNGIQGLMVWGQDNQLNVTVSRAGFWDHRGGKPFGATTNFKTVKRFLENGQQDSLKLIFKNENKEG